MIKLLSRKPKIGRAVQQECRDRSRMPSSACTAKPACAIHTLSLHDALPISLPALTVKLSKYNVDDVALGVCKTGAEEAGVTEVRTSLSEKKFELWREIKV